MKCTRAVEAARARELAGRAEQHRGVAVVAAAVVHAGDPARMAEARLLGDRQRVHVGAQAHASRVLLPLRSTPTTPVPPMPSCTSSPSSAHERATMRGRAALLEGQFGMRVQIAPQRDQFGSRSSTAATVSQRPASTASANSASVRKW